MYGCSIAIFKESYLMSILMNIEETIKVSQRCASLLHYTNISSTKMAVESTFVKTETHGIECDTQRHY